MVKYNIYIICKNEEIFLQKCKEFEKYKSKICHIQWIPAEYLKLTQCNKKLLKDLNTRYNTQSKKILAKLGTIAAHRKALLAIFSSKTNNNIILEEDATLTMSLPTPPKESCYFGGWIIPPQITKAGKVKMNVHPKKGMNKIAQKVSEETAETIIEAVQGNKKLAGYLVKKFIALVPVIIITTKKDNNSVQNKEISLFSKYLIDKIIS